MTKKRDLPKYTYARDNKIWVRFKNEHGKWVSKRTPYSVDQVEFARQFVTALLRGVQRKRDRGKSKPETVTDWAYEWCNDREERGVKCAPSDRSRLEKYALPYLGDVLLEQLRPRHVLEMVEKLKALAAASETGTPAPRTIHHVYNTLHSMMRSAIVKELFFGANPVALELGDMPKKVDADREWRALATFETWEIEKLISSPLIPVERRVQYVLKALEAMRHGEVAGMCWRHRVRNAMPLPKLNIVQAWSTPNKELKRTKNDETRVVPEHPVTTAILDAWHDVHWERIYGRKPTPDDFIVPARTGSCVDAGDANEAFKRDLKALGLRVEAGERRDRGGHDLRSWFMTQTIDDGADSLIADRFTHAPPKTVTAGYRRFSWDTLCRELQKLRVTLDGEPLRLATDSLQVAKKAGARWTCVVTPKGLEPFDSDGVQSYKKQLLDERTRATQSSATTRTDNAVAAPLRRGYVRTAGRMLEKAILAGDLTRALIIARELEST